MLMKYTVFGIFGALGGSGVRLLALLKYIPKLFHFTNAKLSDDVLKTKL